MSSETSPLRVTNTTCAKIPDENATILQASDDAGVLTADGQGNRVGTGLPFFKQRPALQIVDDDEIGIARLQFLHASPNRVIYSCGLSEVHMSLWNHLANTGDVGAFASDGAKPGREFVVKHLEVVNELFGLQVPDEKRTRPFGLIPADEDPTVVRNEQ